ncbi:hypothetical protein A6E04_19375 [Aliivibrio logei]|uniref:Uncharacterized protein n=1 Tax=Aliivibrio logei TaxID=688 RepID=A0A1B9NTK7_ALILO|nr:hypothetical protein A6E04_19375 [Aliivibrio logei]
MISVQIFSVTKHQLISIVPYCEYSSNFYRAIVEMEIKHNKFAEEMIIFPHEKIAIITLNNDQQVVIRESADHDEH